MNKKDRNMIKVLLLALINKDKEIFAFSKTLQNNKNLYKFVAEPNEIIPNVISKKSDYKNNEIRKSIVPIIRIISNEEIDNIPVLKGTLRISNMIPVPDSELLLYEPKKEKNEDYRILVEKELEFIGKKECS